MAQSEGETVKAPGRQPRRATPERPVTSGTAHPRKRMAEMPIWDNQGGTVEFSAPDCGQGRFFVPPAKKEGEG